MLRYYQYYVESDACLFFCSSSRTMLRKPDFKLFRPFARYRFSSAVMRYETILMVYGFECDVQTVRRCMLGASTV